MESDLLEEIDMITSFIDPNEVDISLTYELEEELSSPNDLSITQEELDRKYGKEQPKKTDEEKQREERMIEHFQKLKEQPLEAESTVLKTFKYRNNQDPYQGN